MKAIYVFVMIFLFNLCLTRTTDRIWQGWVKRESGSAGYRQVNGDRGNAFGKYQFDRRYGLVPFMTYCRNYSPSHYSGFDKFIAMGPGAESLKGNQELAALWISYCDQYPAEFEALQDVCGYKDYYLEIKKYLKKLYNINLDNHSPSVKGTAFSMAIRTGPLAAAWKFAALTDSSNDRTILDVTYKSYGDADAGRWTIARQYGDAIIALENGEYTEVPTSM